MAHGGVLARKAAEQASPTRTVVTSSSAMRGTTGRAARPELDGLLRSHDATVWFSERDVGLGTPLLREIDRGLASSRVGIVLVTPAILNTLKAGHRRQGVVNAARHRPGDPVAHGTTSEALREVSPMLASRSGPDTAETSLADVAAKIAAAAAALADADI